MERSRARQILYEMDINSLSGIRVVIANLKITSGTLKRIQLKKISLFMLDGQQKYMMFHLIPDVMQKLNLKRLKQVIKS